MKHSKGFTVIELLVIIGILAVLATIILVNLNNSAQKAKDKTIIANLSSMRTQAALYTGPVGTPMTNFSTAKLVTGTNLFDGPTTNNSLITMINGMPNSTPYYYGWNGVLPSLGGLWFVSASTSLGASCVDSSGLSRSVAGTPPTSAVGFTTLFTNLGTYSCR